MTVKSIVDIDVNSEQFKDFYKLFEEFHAKVGEIPEGFGKIGSEAKGSAADFALLSAQAHKISVETGKIAIELQKAGIAQDSFNRKSEKSAKTIKSMAKESGSLASMLGSVASKAGIVVAGIGMVLSAADKLADYAVSGQRKARGVGLNQGQQRAFDINFNRFVDPSILGNISESQSDLTGRMWLSKAAGVSYNQAASMGVDELAMREIKNAHDWWNRTPASMRVQNSPQAQFFLKSGMSWEDIRRAGNSTDEEISQAQRDYAKDKNTLAISDKNITPLYRGLRYEKLKMNEAASLAASGLGASGNYLAQLMPRLNQYLAHFGNSIENLARKIDKITGGSVVIPGSFEKLTPAEKSQYLDARKHEFVNGTYNTSGFSTLESKFGLPKGLLSGIYQTESGGGRELKSSAGALGPFQLMPQTAKHYGLDNPFSIYGSSLAASEYEQAELTKYHGDMRKAIAAYNLGDAKLDADIAKNGKDWEKHLPKETRDYIGRVIQNMAQAKTSVVIMNKTGADMYTTTNAMAH